MLTHIHQTVTLAPGWINGQYLATQPAADRLNTITSLLDQAQVAALLVTVDKGLISQEPEFAKVTRDLRNTLFPHHFDARKLERKFRFLGQTLLDHRNDLKYKKRLPSYVPDAELDRYIVKQPLKSFGQMTLARLQQNVATDGIQKWGDLYQQVDPSQYDQLQRLRDIGRQAARADIGIPPECQNPDGEDRSLLANCMKCRSDEGLSELQDSNILPQYGQVIIGADMQEREGLCCWATCYRHVIKLCPRFFTLMEFGEQEIGEINSSSQIADLMPSSLKTILHEYFHTDAMGHAVDVKITDTVLYDALREPSPAHCDGTALNWCTTDGLDMLLAAIDNQKGTNLCEDNADSWARYAWFYMAIIAYPEFDFLSGPKIQRRKTLLHHCSLLDYIRADSTGSIQELPGYNSSKDFFARPRKSRKSVKSVLLLLLKMTNEWEKPARSLAKILKELNLRTESDPPRANEEQDKEDESALCRANEGQDTQDQRVSDDNKVSKPLRLTNPQKAFLRADFEIGGLRKDYSSADLLPFMKKRRS